jgi:hypothetical protein
MTSTIGVKREFIAEHIKEEIEDGEVTEAETACFARAKKQMRHNVLSITGEMQTHKPLHQKIEDFMYGLNLTSIDIDPRIADFQKDANATLHLKVLEVVKATFCDEHYRKVVDVVVHFRKYTDLKISVDLVFANGVTFECFGPEFKTEVALYCGTFAEVAALLNCYFELTSGESSLIDYHGARMVRVLVERLHAVTKVYKCRDTSGMTAHLGINDLERVCAKFLDENSVK